MANIYPNGIGGTLGDALATCRPLYFTGVVWYVDSATGFDAVSPAGRNRERPLATLAQALTNASNDDIIVFLSGHHETLTSKQTVSKRLTLVGEGSAAGVPTVVFTRSADFTGISLEAALSEIRNVKFAQSTVAGVTTSPSLSVGATDITIEGCYIECGAHDALGLALGSGTDRMRIRNTTIISTATSSSAQPATGANSFGAIADMVWDGLVVSAGTVGFSNYFAVDCSAAALTRLKGINVSLLLGADVNLHASSTGRLNIQTASGGSRVQW